MPYITCRQSLTSDSPERRMAGCRRTEHDWFRCSSRFRMSRTAEPTAGAPSWEAIQTGLKTSAGGAVPTRSPPVHNRPRCKTALTPTWLHSATKLPTRHCKPAIGRTRRTQAPSRCADRPAGRPARPLVRNRHTAWGVSHQGSMPHERLPDPPHAEPAEASPFTSHSRVCAGSMTASISSVAAMLMALPFA